MNVSIVIPAFNEQRLLDRSLSTLEPQRDEFLECIVVDDGSDPPLTLPPWVHRVRIDRPSRHRGSSAAKNEGARHAIGDWLLITDSDFLHVNDAVASIKAAAAHFAPRCAGRILLNTVRSEIPKDYPEFDPWRLDEFLAVAEQDGYILDPEMKSPYGRAWEQNFSMIRRDYFWVLGGYDEIGFPSWGFNNHDLCMRVVQDGGYITSDIPRLLTGRRLICVHQYHDNGVPDRTQADKEFSAKWGETWYHGLPTARFGRNIQEYTLCRKK